MDQHYKNTIIRPVISVLALSVFSACTPSENGSNSPPNIVVLLADDLAYRDLACYGNKKVYTPNTDRMAAEGMRFTDFHADGLGSSPTRAALLTGRYPQRTGVPAVGGVLNENEITIAKRLRDEAGYETAVFGKWHISGHARSREFYAERSPLKFGFNEFRGFMSGFIDFHSHVNHDGQPDWWHNNQLVKEEGFATHLITNHAVRFIKENHEKPFFLYVPFDAIHFPWMTPDDPPFFEEGNDYSDSRLRIGQHHGNPRLRDVVYRMIEELDHGIGRIIETLENVGVANKTLVIFLSDDGGYIDYMGLNKHQISNMGPFRGQKLDVYEGGHRVAAIAWWPGRIPAGVVSDEIAITHDLFPTFLELTGLKPPSPESRNALDGISLVPLLLNNKSIPERKLFWEFRGNSAVREGKWKLVSIGKNDPELYDLNNDPGENFDLADKYPDRVNTLLNALIEWELQVK